MATLVGRARAGNAGSGEGRRGGRRTGGRGAGVNPDGRFEPHRRTAEEAQPPADPEEDRPAPRTVVREERAGRVISRNESPDLGFDRSINPYRGCEHGCVYCFARPTHAYLGLSPGLDFETLLSAKPDAAALLRRELSARGYAAGTVVLGANTDAYQPVERTRGIARQVLEVLEEAGHPVTVVTKSALVTRDLDILSRMAARGLARVALSVTTLEDGLARRLEPRAPRPARRLEAMARLAAAGVPVTVLMAPLIPAINDAELEAVLAAARKAGASHAGYVVLRLPLEVEEIFVDWLERHHPDRARRVMQLVRSMRGGKAYDPRWGKRLTGEGPYAALLADRFALAARREGLSRERLALRTDLFEPPGRADGQLRLL